MGNIKTGLRKRMGVVLKLVPLSANVLQCIVSPVFIGIKRSW